MSNKDRLGNEKVVIVRNTSGKKKIWDGPKSSQHTDGPHSKSIRFHEDGSVAMTADQLATMGKPPRGCVIETYDESKHGPKNRAGE